MDSKAIGLKLAQLRENKGLTQQQLADSIGITPSAVGMYERGERIPRDEIKIKLASFFDTSIEVLFF